MSMYAQVFERLKMSTLYTSGQNVKKCHHYTQVVKRLEVSTLYISGLH